MTAASRAPAGQNRLVLTAQVVERAAMRYTPAGLPAVDVRLAHESTLLHDGAPRRISLEIHATAIGELARSLERMAVGKTAEFSGFLARQRNGRGLMLHIDQIADRCNDSVSTEE
ncbi:MAG: hypothetical protein RJA44_1794 [Pseudomonadota bacterium]|jgi:primosomal replication protein N